MRTRKWRRRTDYLKDKRKRKLADYADLASSIWFDDEQNRVRYCGDGKKSEKRIASRRFRRTNNEELMNGNTYRKYYPLRYMII